VNRHRRQSIHRLRQLWMTLQIVEPFSNVLVYPAIIPGVAGKDSRVDRKRSGCPSTILRARESMRD
jgi:hypothetical protein